MPAHGAVTLSRLQVKARPTNADVMAAIGELHDCVHAVGEEVQGVKREVSEVRHTQRNDSTKFDGAINAIDRRLSYMEGRSDAVAQRLGVKTVEGQPAPVQKPITSHLSWGTTLKVATAVTALAGAYKILWPAVIAAWPALQKAMLG